VDYTEESILRRLLSVAFLISCAHAPAPAPVCEEPGPRIGLCQMLPETLKSGMVRDDCVSIDGASTACCRYHEAGDEEAKHFLCTTNCFVWEEMRAPEKEGAEEQSL
jgi:hypothetical protein